jgi:hypothetical protein
MEVRVSGAVGVNGELATRTAYRIIIILLNEGENRDNHGAPQNTVRTTRAATTRPSFCPLIAYIPPLAPTQTGLSRSQSMSG